MDKYLLFYYACMVFGFVVNIIFLFAARKRFGMTMRDCVASAFFGIGFSVFSAVLMAYLYNEIILFASDGTVQAASRFRLFGVFLFAPVLMYFALKKSGMRTDFHMDLYAATTILALGCSKIGCFGYGCCYGVAWEHGVINRLTGLQVVPVQLLEVLCCFALAAVLFVLLFKGKCKGFLFPLSQIFYSVPRFFLEYLRHYDFAVEGDILLNLSVWQVFSVVTMLIGVVWLIVKIKKKQY